MKSKKKAVKNVSFMGHKVIKRQDKTIKKQDNKQKKLLPQSPQSPQNKKIKINHRSEAMQLRQEFTDTLDRLGYAISDIVEILKSGRGKENDVNGKYHVMLGSSVNIYELIRNDLQVVRKNRKALLFTNEGERTREEYIAKQLALFHASIKVKDYKTASEILDKVSRARGIDMSTPVIITPQVNVTNIHGQNQAIIMSIDKIQKLPLDKRYEAYKRDFIPLLQLEDKITKANEQSGEPEE